MWGEVSMAKITLTALAERFAAMPNKFEACVKLELKRVGMRVRDTAVRKFGTYQPASGPYDSWSALSPRTILEKQEAGATSDDPLIGHYPPGKKNMVWPAPLRTTIESDVEGLRVNVGTADPLGEYHEYGTESEGGGIHIPPRPFLRPAAFETEDYFRDRMKIAWEEAVKLL